MATESRSLSKALRVVFTYLRTAQVGWFRSGNVLGQRTEGAAPRRSCSDLAFFYQSDVDCAMDCEKGLNASAVRARVKDFFEKTIGRRLTRFMREKTKRSAPSSSEVEPQWRQAATDRL